MDQHVFLKILRMILMMTREYKKCCNASLLIYIEDIFLSKTKNK